jgi:periplasmic copper chaperone A
MQIKKFTFAAIVCAAVLAFVQGAPARAEEVKAGDLVITEAWTRATPKGAKIGGGYLTIENKGTAPDRLIGSSADIAGSVQVHEMSMDKGVMKMRPLENGLAIEPGKTVKLTPGGYHLMMMDLKSRSRRATSCRSRWSSRRPARCACRKSNSHIQMMKSAKKWRRQNATNGMYGSRRRRVLVE